MLPTLSAQGIRFDIVNYDFHGQYCKKHNDILERTPVADDALLIYNALGKREDPKTKNKLVESETLMVHGRERDKRWLESLGSARDAARLAGHLSLKAEEFVPRTELKEMRHNIVPMAVASSLGYHTRRPDRSLMLRVLDIAYPQADMQAARQAPDENLRAAVSVMFGDFRRFAPVSLHMLGTLLKETYNASILGGCEPMDLGLAVWHSTFGMPYWAGGIYIYEYLSESNPGGRRSPFTTTARRLMQADAVLVGHERAFEFAAAWLNEWWRMEMGGDAAGSDALVYEIVDRRGTRRGRGAKLEWNDDLRLYRDGTVTASIQLGDLRSAMLAVTAARKKYSLAL